MSLLYLKVTPGHLNGFPVGNLEGFLAGEKEKKPSTIPIITVITRVDKIIQGTYFLSKLLSMVSPIESPRDIIARLTETFGSSEREAGRCAGRVKGRQEGREEKRKTGRKVVTSRGRLVEVGRKEDGWERKQDGRQDGLKIGRKVER